VGAWQGEEKLGALRVAGGKRLGKIRTWTASGNIPVSASRKIWAGAVTADRDGWEFSHVLERGGQKNLREREQLEKFKDRERTAGGRKIFSFLLFLHSRV
jgi:hypothetical protein